MRLRFWRKKKRAVFDPEAGEIPEHLEVWPKTPFVWRDFCRSAFWAVVRGSAGVILASLTLHACRSLDDGGAANDAERKSWPLIVVEAAPLDEVCRADTHLLSLRSVAPCDGGSRGLLSLQPDRRYYVAFAAHGFDSYSVLTPAYLLEGGCYDAVHDQSESAERCVVATLRN